MFKVQARHPSETEWNDVVLDKPVSKYIDALGALRRYNETCENENDRVRIVNVNTNETIIETDAWMH